MKRGPVDLAQCFIQPILVNGAVLGEATLDQIKAAAAEVVAGCAFRPSSGGIAHNIGMPSPRAPSPSFPYLSVVTNSNPDIGGDGNVAVIVGKYQPSVTCRGLIPHWDSCISVLCRMPAGQEELIMGPPSDPRHQVGLPVFISTGEFFSPFVQLQFGRFGGEEMFGLMDDGGGMDR